MLPPPKTPESKVTILDEADVEAMLRRLDDLYLYLADMMIVRRRYALRLTTSKPAEKVVPFPSPRYPQSRSPEERERP